MRYNEQALAVDSVEDFIPRPRKSSLMYLAMSYVIAALLLFIVIMYGDIAGSPFLIVVTSIFILTALGFYSFFSKQRNLDLVMANEFQNALFANAVSIGWAFVLFIKRDGTIVYANDGLKKRFPEAAYDQFQALDALLREGQVDKDDADKIFQCLTKNEPGRLIFSIRNEKGEMRPIMMSIEPLKRPKGFFVLRARDYVESRSGQEETGGIEVVLQSLVDHSPYGMFSCNGEGEITYANTALEDMLGYRSGELQRKPFNLRELIYQVGDQPVGEWELNDFEGEVLLQRRNGSLLKTQLAQQVHRDKTGRAIGSSAYVQPN